MEQKKNKIELYHITALIGLVLLSKLTIDLYIPILLSIKNALNADNLSLKLSLTTYMIGFAFSLLASAPLADRFGPRKIMILSTINYTIAALVCAYAQDITTIIIARLFQSLSGGAGTVLGRLEVNHHYTHQIQLKALSYISAVTALTPVILPMFANYVSIEYGWRMVFIVMAIFSSISFFLTIFFVKESSKKRSPLSLLNLAKTYKDLLCNKLFLSLTFITICTWCTYFIYLAASPFIFQEYLGAGQTEFTIIFAVTSTGYAIGSILVSKFAHKHSLEKMLWQACLLMFYFSILLGIVAWLLPISKLILAAILCATLLFVGIILPCTQALLLNNFKENTSNAVGLYFFLQFLAGALGGMSIQYLQGPNLLYAIAGIFIVCSALRLAVYYYTIYKPSTDQH